ncbi:protein far1-related sequence 11 [Gigaspora margarita]|uniref:Protein far1-related sequence 11 n=1 Tax=Gigaspora margarita TaxID=4874 RepID=A0A8H4A006_GIGMA|nr:protein far1-related sequence 11 [Gigaspora margarita]
MKIFNQDHVFFINNSPGIIRPKGLTIIASELQKMFLSMNIITKESCSSIKRDQYLFNVLVSKTTICLIMEDYYCDYDKAKNIIRQSIEFGRVSNPINDESDESNL